MHFILFLLLALVPSLCVLSLEIPSQPEMPNGGGEGPQQFSNSPFDNSQQSLLANNEINSELADSKKSTSSVTRHQFKVCSSMTILPLHDFSSCSQTIQRLANAVCRSGGGSGISNIANLGFNGRSRRSSSSASDDASGELEDALLEFTNSNNRNNPDYWAQEQQQQQQLKRSASFYGNQQQQQAQQQQVYGHHAGSAYDQVKRNLIRKCCKYNSICQIEFVVESLSDSCNGGFFGSSSTQTHQQQPLHVAKARA